MPSPLHPAIVHFPLVLAVLIPFAVVFALLIIARGASPRSAWILVFVMAVGLTASAWVAVETGQQQGDVVEAVVPEAAIERHEEAAETLLVASLVLLAIVAVGMTPRRIGKAARMVAAPAAIVLLAMAIRVGDSGGKLVYTHGAASAYMVQRAGEATPPDLRRGDDDRRGGDDRRGDDGDR